MKTINLDDALQKKPFRAFQLHMDSGDKIPVKHPECVLFSGSRNTAVVADGEHFHIVDVAHIGSVSFSGGTGKGKVVS